MRIEVKSATEVSLLLASQGIHATRATVARAADRAGVGVYTQEITSEGKPRRNKKGEIVLRCVGIAESDIPAVARHINDTPGNPTFGSPKPATVKRHLASRFAAAKRRVHGVRVRRPAAAFRAKTRA